VSEVEVDELGASLGYATVTITKTSQRGAREVPVEDR
jgi:hypothetical protein